jgi:hypothetical protein
MQDVNNQPLLRGRTKNLLEHREFTSTSENWEFVLFGDNLLECLTLLNPAIEQNDIWIFLYVVYEPIDEPIYVFRTPEGRLVSIKACGAYSNWPLPEKVSELIYRCDLPDFVLYSITNNKILLAGEFTESAPPGNAQWQREYRKISAAELNVPFVYKTVYSEKDDKQNTIREPQSLLVYNAFLYSIRYKIPSLVFFVETNIPTSRTRERVDSLSPDVIARLFAAYLLNDIGENFTLFRSIEEEIYTSMANYLKEFKYTVGSTQIEEPRLVLDLPCINENVKKALLWETKMFVSELSKLLSNPESEKSKFVQKYDFSNLDVNKMTEWTDKKNTSYISYLFNYLNEGNFPPALAPKWKFAAGIVKSKFVIEFLVDSGYKVSKSSLEKLSAHEETAIIPVALHKANKGSLQFNKDPYSGNTAAFSELLGFDSYGKSIRNILVFCVSTSPAGFNIHSKYETHLYQTIARYADILVLDSKETVDEFKSSSKKYDTHSIQSISAVTRIQRTEDMGLLSTYLQMGVIASDWDVCMIAVHHAPWQQIRLRDNVNILDTRKILRDEAKLDLVMQSKDNVFFAAEGKKNFSDFFNTKEQEKIALAFQNTQNIIDSLYKSNGNLKIISFICLLEAPEIGTDIFLKAERQKILDTIKSGGLDKIAKQEFVVIGVYTRENLTNFEVFYSRNFPITMQTRMNEIFEN